MQDQRVQRRGCSLCLFALSRVSPFCKDVKYITYPVCFSLFSLIFIHVLITHPLADLNPASPSSSHSKQPQSTYHVPPLCLRWSKAPILRVSYLPFFPAHIKAVIPTAHYCRSISGWCMNIWWGVKSWMKVLRLLSSVHLWTLWKADRIRILSCVDLYFFWSRSLVGCWCASDCSSGATSYYRHSPRNVVSQHKLLKQSSVQWQTLLLACLHGNSWKRPSPYSRRRTR